MSYTLKAGESLGDAPAPDVPVPFDEWRRLLVDGKSTGQLVRVASARRVADCLADALGV